MAERLIASDCKSGPNGTVVQIHPDPPLWSRSLKVTISHCHCDEEGALPFGTAIGKLVEWSITPVLKTGDVKASVGSNPTLTANIGV